MHPINRIVHMAFRLYMCILIMFRCFLTSVYVPNRAMLRLQQNCPETFSPIRTLVHYGGQLSPDLAPIEHVWDILWHNIRSHNNVRTQHQITAALCREWIAIAQNDIQTIMFSMFHKCTACVRADRGHTSY